MEFLKEILGDELYTQVAEKINAYNGNEANKEKQIKLANLGSGEYVGKGKHDAEVERLNALLTDKDADIQGLTDTIESLKEGKIDADTLQQRIGDAERLVNEAKAREAETKLKYALRDALRDEKALDIDYVTFKINEKMRAEGKTLELDENEKIKGWDDLISGVKTQLPKQFETKGSGGVDPNPLPEGTHTETEPQTLADAIQQKYENK